MTKDRVIVPIGPGRGQEKPLMDAWQAVILEMRGHVRDLRDSGEEDQAALVERYAVAFDLIWQQSYQRSLFGVGIQDDLARLARQYRLSVP
ncbi:MAG: hypothetical protein PHQ40_20650 [Anaerolineaceae bacterium]|nr:hypothetical protein [Anaerolineaceae bacterium]MDD5371496.1 hypothetical protein [Anaerolineaceae bacterium]